MLAVRRHDHSRYRSLLITLASYGYDFDAPSVTAPHETAKSIIEARGQALLLASSRMAGGETTLSDEEATRRFPVGTETVGCARAQVPGRNRERYGVRAHGSRDQEQQFVLLEHSYSTLVVLVRLSGNVLSRFGRTATSSTTCFLMLEPMHVCMCMCT